MIDASPMNIKSVVRLAAFLVPLALSAQSFDIALIGDEPYGTAAEPKFERVLADINKTGVDLTFHIGDTKSGSTRCDDTHYPKILNWFNSLDTALVYTPGDNEWTDCMRVNNGGYDPLSRLALVRKTYFPSNMSLGRRPIALQKQSDDARYSKFVENSMLVKGPVVFATIHVTGSNNNLEYKTVQGVVNKFYDNDVEYTERNTANLAWLKKAFETAKANKSLGVMLFVQANIFEDFMVTGIGNVKSGYVDFVRDLRTEVGAFAGEVVVVSGDSHYMRVDKPLTDRYPACLSAQGTCAPFTGAPDTLGTRVLNFTRAVVPGSGDVHWMICHVRPNARNLFTFEFMIMPEVGTGPTGARAVVTGPGATGAANTFQTIDGILTLDASSSATSNTGDVTYSWANAAGSQTAAILGANTAKPTVQLVLRGTYELVLTVTDRTGASATAPVTIIY